MDFLRPEVLTATLQKQHAAMTVFVSGKNVPTPWGIAAGMADASTARSLTIDTPLRVASNTKTFVAATVLRLWEQGAISLDAPIASLLAPALQRLLTSRGYRTDKITVRHLLSHSAGVFDHADDPRYFKAVLANPTHHWTREEQVALSCHYAGPTSEPGQEYMYSDTGYVLLGDIVERVTQQSLAQSVRHQLRFDERGLASTWWELAETQPAGTQARARQFLDDVAVTDVTDVSATLDLYGGGGLVMSVRDLATFHQDLFENRVFDDPATLTEMLRKGEHEDAEEYRLGVAVKRVNGRECYSHTGFWGTAVYYSPDAGVSIAGFTTHRAERVALVKLIEEAIGGR
ncbi:serine hydrolase [Burkholderia sp. S171]|uniref:serine hydrolase domain-containing protein n=1 Tax=Burkholderia sp. S171 TaxID=1641860 RepID=UPI0020B11123|nr:serine hydrolase domain-containing protein [Burkholderia sp. S171]